MKKRNLFLGEYENTLKTDVVEDIVNNYLVEKSIVDEYQIIIAVLNSYDYEEDSYFLLLHKSTGKLFENFGSHCSCYGFEGQFEPEETSVVYLMSDNYQHRNNKDIMDFLNDGILKSIYREKKLERILNDEKPKV